MVSKAATFGQSLVPQEHRCLVLAAEGLTYAEIGRVLFVARTTVHSHLRCVRIKLGARNTRDAVRIGYETGLLPAKVGRP